MPPRPLLKKPPPSPDTPLPRSKAPGWFELATQTLGGMIGLPPLSAEDYDTPEGGRSIERAGSLGELLSMGAVPLAMAGAMKGSLGQMLGKRIPNPIKAYHGSPHDFDKFSLEKIGTGEGAQAYGHGLYFAENEGVAKQYRDMLTGKTRAGAALNWDDPVDVASMRMHQFQGDSDAAIRFIEGQRPNPNVSTANAKAAKFADEAITAIREGKATRKVDTGRTYEVNIHATPDELLDWDKPLSQQPEKVKAGASQEFRNVQPVQVKPGWYSVTRVGTDGVGRTMTSEIFESSPEAAMQRFGEYISSETGESLIRRLGSPEQASVSLKERGIKGIQYLDQGSRGTSVQYEATKRLVEKAKAGGHTARAAELQAKLDTMQAPTKNFVIFDDELIEIAKKYGIPLATAASLVEQQGGTVQQRP